MRFNGEYLKREHVLAARKHFVDNCLQCISDAQDGTTKVNDLGTYTAWQKGMADAYEQGLYDETFTMMQHAYYLQTDKCVALLP